MADNTWLLLGAAAVGGYLWYRKSQGSVATVTTPVPMPAVPGPLPAGAPGVPAPNLDRIYNAILGYVSNDGGDPWSGLYVTSKAPITITEWNSYLAVASGLTPPDVNALFSSDVVNKYWSGPMPITAYWPVVSAWLKQKYGLSGLGIFGGLGALAMVGRY